MYSKKWRKDIKMYYFSYYIFIDAFPSNQRTIGFDDFWTKFITSDFKPYKMSFRINQDTIKFTIAIKSNHYLGEDGLNDIFNTFLPEGFTEGPPWWARG